MRLSIYLSLLFVVAVSARGSDVHIEVDFTANEDSKTAMLDVTASVQNVVIGLPGYHASVLNGIIDTTGPHSCAVDVPLLLSLYRAAIAYPVTFIDCKDSS